MKYLLLMFLISCGFKGEAPRPAVIDTGDLDSDGIINSEDSRPLIADFPRVDIFRVKNNEDGLILDNKLNQELSTKHLNKILGEEKSLDYELIDEILHTRSFSSGDQFAVAFNKKDSETIDGELSVALDINKLDSFDSIGNISLEFGNSDNALIRTFDNELQFEDLTKLNRLYELPFNVRHKEDIVRQMIRGNESSLRVLDFVYKRDDQEFSYKEIQENVRNNNALVIFRDALGRVDYEYVSPIMDLSEYLALKNIEANFLNNTIHSFNGKYQSQNKDLGSSLDEQHFDFLTSDMAYNGKLKSSEVYVVTVSDSSSLLSDSKHISKKIINSTEKISIDGMIGDRIVAKITPLFNVHAPAAKLWREKGYYLGCREFPDPGGWGEGYSLQAMFSQEQKCDSRPKRKVSNGCSVREVTAAVRTQSLTHEELLSQIRSSIENVFTSVIFYEGSFYARGALNAGSNLLIDTPMKSSVSIPITRVRTRTGARCKGEACKCYHGNESIASSAPIKLLYNVEVEHFGMKR